MLPNRLPLVMGLYLMKYGCPNNNSNIVRSASSSTLLARGRQARGRCRVDWQRGITLAPRPPKTACHPSCGFRPTKHCPSCGFRCWLIVCLSSVFPAAHMVDTMNFRVYALGSMNFSVVAHSPRIPPGKQLNVPQPGFSPLSNIYILKSAAAALWRFGPALLSSAGVRCALMR